MRMGGGARMRVVSTLTIKRGVNMTSKRFMWIAIGIASVQALNVINFFAITKVQNAMY